MSIRTRIEHKLTEALAPARLEVIDESARHTGHAGANPEGESHFRVVVVAAAFEGKGRVERQRMVYAALADELRERVHALSLSLHTPQEEKPH